MPIREPNAKVFLVGFMGTGKTTLGKLLAERLGWEFADLDSAIEEQEGTSVARIFAEKGEAHFRGVEKSALARLTGLAGQVVIACGGGTFCESENQELMNRCGITVWLDQPFDQIWARQIELAAVRPLMKTEAETRALHADRIAFYQRATFHLRVREDGMRSALEELVRILGVPRS